MRLEAALGLLSWRYNRLPALVGFTLGFLSNEESSRSERVDFSELAGDSYVINGVANLSVAVGKAYHNHFRQKVVDEMR